jgi:hypothetical protein
MAVVNKWSYNSFLNFFYRNFVASLGLQRPIAEWGGKMVILNSGIRWTFSHTRGAGTKWRMPVLDVQSRE